MALNDRVIELDLYDYLRGDTMESYTFSPSISGPPGPITAVRIYFREYKYSGTLLTAFTSSGATPDIEILNAATWQIQTSPKVITSTFVGTAAYDVEYTYTDSVTSESLVKTLYIGKMKIVGDSTYT